MIWLKFNFFVNLVILIIKEIVLENFNCMLFCRCKLSCKIFDIIVWIIKLGYYFKSNYLKLYVYVLFKFVVSFFWYFFVIWSIIVDYLGFFILNVFKVFYVMMFLRRFYY